jgi:F420-0:gamma-glutamyl ligase-like protein
LSKEDNLEKLREKVAEVENYEILKRLANETAVYIGKKQRDRYYQVLDLYFSKYEKVNNSSDKQSK